jgi:tRNA nucleotidyltransferase (CCA-adding enzyme)
MVEIYKVGGAVRDLLLGLNPTDNDYVVVGANHEYMISHGFLKVGKDFPVYLHPVTHEEYALARLERKSGVGHKEFTFDTNEKVTLLEDLKRRDITINAMAIDSNDKLIDPFNGQNDLANKIIRHVSGSFSEDPLRVLRVARFSAKFNFTIAPETLTLIKDIVKSNELLTISQERINNEIVKALDTKYTSNFFEILIITNAIKQVLPSLAKNLTEQNIKNEFDLVIDYISKNNIELDEKLTILAFYMKDSNQFTKRVKRLSNILIKYLNKIESLDKLSTHEILLMIKIIDPIRRPNDYESIKRIVIIIATLRLNEKMQNNIEILSDIILKFRGIKYLNTSDNIAHHISDEKINIIESVINIKGR